MSSWLPQVRVQLPSARLTLSVFEVGTNSDGNTYEKVPQLSLGFLVGLAYAKGVLRLLALGWVVVGSLSGTVLRMV